MRFIYLLSFLLLICISTNSAQNISLVPLEQKPGIKGYPICGNIFLQKQNKEVAKYIKAHPNMYSKMKMEKTSAWNFNINSKHIWFALNLVTGQRYAVSSTCKGIGNHCYVFVDDAEWNSKVNQTAVDSIVNEFENKTPANPNKGIYQTDVETFGNPPDVDNDSHIIILIYDIKDYYETTSTWVPGYFDGYNETNQIESNKAEIYYMDCNPTDLTTSYGIEVAYETIAHEFQHMIHWNYHKTFRELTFIDESCSMFAEINCGYHSSFQSLYAGEPNHYLLDWRSDSNPNFLNDYGRAQRLAIYFNDQFGSSIFKHIVQNGLTGIDGLKNSLLLSGQSISFTNVFINWEVANKLDERSINSAYGYIYPNLPKSVSKTFYNPNVTATDTIDRLAAEYITFTNGSNLNINFVPQSSENSLIIKAIEIGENTTRVLDVSPNTNFFEQEYGSVYKTIHFVLIDTNEISKQIVTYKATGSAQKKVELKYDNTEPIGYFKLSPSDTICVTFNEVPGGILDSIKVALLQAGNITGGIWEFMGDALPTPLGKPLAVPVTASIKTNTSIPYPVPYKNWCTLNLTAKSISTNKAFAVGFVVGADASKPGIMVTNFPGQDPYHSFTYLHNPNSGSPDWYYIGTSSNTIGIYLIRAYVGITATGVKKVLELFPKDFSLSQNYPNPFNPSTKINFELPSKENVRITVYNQLGQQIMVAADREYMPGRYSININCSNLASGVYYYRIKAGSFAKTRKMVFMK